MVEMICLLTRWLSVKFIFFGIVLMLHCQELNARVTEVRCDPDIPSRPQPDVNVHAIAMPQSDIHVTNCTEGEYLDWYKCSPCQEGTFRTKQIAALDRYSWCQSCQEPGTYEIIVEPCTKSRDAKIMCEDGFYRLEVPEMPCKSECVRCDICGVGRNMFKNFEARECGGYNNTACCEHEDMVVKDEQCVTITTSTREKTTITTTTTSSVTDNMEGFQAGFVGQSAIHRISNCLWIICLVTFVLCT
ncbi:uncharacterized protein LOC129923705 isoform X1 [Biomphalaria glabrata]|uniref:Uncharacterized protein LOC129923705 isoform X1 n=2 Tax=Biomphalaria glabrata TaxID=6526 RepID=A0A9W2ZAN3_BIOGL|nr:uncharacterized protein LOC129923705 isoform X1 [Biomphalaria glabrata]